MATQKSIEAILRARDANFTSTFSKASSFVDKFKNTNHSAVGSIKSIVGAMGIFKVASAGVSLVTGQVQSALGRSDTMNNFTRNMTRVTGSTTMAKSELDKLKVATKGTAYGLDGVASTMQSFANSGVAIDKSSKYAIDWMDAISAYGDGTTATYNQVMLQLNQMASKGKANMGDLKSAMEAGIPVTQILGDKWKMTGEEVQKAISDGKVSSEEFMDAMSEAFTNGTDKFKAIAGESKKAGDSWKGTIDNMKAATTRGVLSVIGSLDNLSIKLTGSSLKEHISSIGKAFEENLTKMGNKFEQLGSVIAPYVEIFKTAFSGVGSSVRNAIMSVLNDLGSMYGSFGNTASVQSFGQIMTNIANKIRSASNWIQAHSQQIATLIPQVVKLAVAYKGLQLAGNLFSPIVQGALTAGSAVQKLGSKLIQMGSVPVGAHTSKMAFSFKTLGTSALSSLGSVGSSLLAIAGPIAIAIALVGSLVAAWTTNFGNIQGFTKSAFSAMQPAFENMKRMLNSFKPVLSTVGTAFKFIGAILIGTVVFSISAVVDAVQLLIADFKTVWDVTKMVGNGIKGIWKTITGDTEGAKEAFDSAGKNFEQMKKTYTDVWDNSAIKGTINATKELGKETDNTSQSQERLTQAMDASKESANQLSGTFSKLNQETQNTAQQLSEAFQENEAMKTFNENSLKLIEEGGKQRQSAIERYNEAINRSEGKSANERQSIMQQANKTFMADFQKSRTDLLTNYNEYNQLLVSNTDKSGQEMNQAQRNALVLARNAVLEELTQTNQTYIDKLRERISMGDVVSKEETETALTNLRELNTQKVEAIQSNNQEIESLKQAQAQTDDAQQKAIMEQEITNLQTKNQQLTESQQAFGENWLALMATQNQTTADQLAVALANEKNLTDENLAGILESYRNNGASVTEQMTLMAGMLQEKGVEGAQNLSTALKSGDLKGIASSMTQDVQNGLISLPPNMFTDGEQGRQKFVEALKSGDTKSAGAQLKEGVTQQTSQTAQKTAQDGKNASDQYNQNVANGKGGANKSGADLSNAVDTGAKSNESKIQNTGKSGGQRYTSGVDTQKSSANNAGNSLANSANQGMKAKEASIQDTGNTAGYRYAIGIDSRLGTARNSGNSLANAAKDGAGSVSFADVGSNMAQGVASGINASAGAAVGAMASLVARVNAEAKKKAEIKSPSRLFKREVGHNIALGVAEGIKEKADVALVNMRSLIQNSLGVATNGSLGRLDYSIEVGGKNPLEDKLDELIQATREKMILDGSAVVGGHPDMIDRIGFANLQDRGRLEF